MAMVDEAEELTDALRTQVLFAREYLKSVDIGPKQVRTCVLAGLKLNGQHPCCITNSDAFLFIKVCEHL